jgi:RNA polymerase sigma factor (TIGR02999 family)
MQPRGEQITQLLQSWNRGDQGAIEKLVPLVYGELHRLARRYMSDERPDHTLQTTALVNEAYVRLVDSAHANWESRTHFFGVCAQVMRRILVDWARSRQALKRV